MATSDPVYLRVVEDIRRQITDGTLPPGAPIPSRAQLTRKYQVGETAARHALRVLASEGLIIGRVGSGHYVRERPDLSPLHRWRFLDHPAPFAADLQSQGRRVTWDWHSEPAEAGPDIAQTAAARRIDHPDEDALCLPRRWPAAPARHLVRASGVRRPHGGGTAQPGRQGVRTRDKDHGDRRKRPHPRAPPRGERRPRSACGHPRPARGTHPLGRRPPSGDQRHRDPGGPLPDHVQHACLTEFERSGPIPASSAWSSAGWPPGLTLHGDQRPTRPHSLDGSPRGRAPGARRG